jgi:hypothetical protein
MDTKIELFEYKYKIVLSVVIQKNKLFTDNFIFIFIFTLNDKFLKQIWQMYYSSQ